MTPPAAVILTVSVIAPLLAAGGPGAGRRAVSQVPERAGLPRPLNDSTNYLPRWSPSGDRLAFTRRDGGDWRISVINADGSGLRRFGEAGGHRDREPSWSPDGTRLTFDSDRAGQREIYLMRLADGAVTRLTDHEAEDTMPAWAPDGSRLVFVSDRSGTRELWTMNAHGGAPRQLTTTGAGWYSTIIRGPSTTRRWASGRSSPSTPTAAIARA